MLFEFLIQKYLLHGPRTIGDLSAVVTGVLLAFNVPSSLPWWIVVIGAFVSIAIAKMTFGGLGKNPFNPALVGRVFLLFAYPVQMTTFPRPVGQLADAFSGATPLAAVKAHIVSHTDINFQDILFGSIPGSLGEISALLLLVGFVLSVVAQGDHVAYSGGDPWYDGRIHLHRRTESGNAGRGPVGVPDLPPAGRWRHSGCSLHGNRLFNLADDPRRMIVYGIGIGVITVLIRLWGAYPEGMSFAILIMNSVVPLINKYVKPHRFGVK